MTAPPLLPFPLAVAGQTRTGSTGHMLIVNNHMIMVGAGLAYSVLT